MCGPEDAKKKAKYVCTACGKEEIKECKEGEEVKSCCGQKMEKKEEYERRKKRERSKWTAPKTPFGFNIKHYLLTY